MHRQNISKEASISLSINVSGCLCVGARARASARASLSRKPPGSNAERMTSFSKSTLHAASNPRFATCSRDELRFHQNQLSSESAYRLTAHRFSAAGAPGHSSSHSDRPCCPAKAAGADAAPASAGCSGAGAGAGVRDKCSAGAVTCGATGVCLSWPAGTSPHASGWPT